MKPKRKPTKRRRHIRLTPEQTIKMLRRLNTILREECYCQTKWADEYHETAEMLAAELKQQKAAPPTPKAQLLATVAELEAEVDRLREMFRNKPEKLTVGRFTLYHARDESIYIDRGAGNLGFEVDVALLETVLRDLWNRRSGKPLLQPSPIPKIRANS